MDAAPAALLHPVFKELPSAAHSDQLAALVDRLLMPLSNSSSSNLKHAEQPIVIQTPLSQYTHQSRN